MTDPDTGRPIVAELGRPETAEETWSRKDTARRARRQHQTAFNLVLALIASLGIVVFLVAVVARPGTTVDRDVDYRQVASQAAVPGVTLAVPDLPDSYTSNRADYARPRRRRRRRLDRRPADARQAVHRHAAGHQGANPTWVANQLDRHRATGSRTIDGTKWTVYDRRDEGKDAGNHAYALVTTFGRSTVVLAGTADDRSFRTVAAAVAEQLG